MLTKEEFIKAHENGETIGVYTNAEIEADWDCVYGGFSWHYYPNGACIEVSQRLNCGEGNDDYEILDNFNPDMDVETAYKEYVKNYEAAKKFDKENSEEEDDE